ncbi:glycosyltransferase family 10 domain-containing protein [Phaeobacter porticola]|uniref:Glycosyltransferase family 10 (Fucosyltransferase) n=1 Tax=Phaeobacter porticola TaxID=1844006 RepID=A0A1L3I6G1_9RHOB|nr:glycosyltransferase family 10 [Phaeobacter porticola]APG47746.1 Glycosyltransferase family 10 (fucosyltransferase) [Phaeobacter porticola]
MREPAIAVAPYGAKLNRDFANQSLSTLHWPLGCPPELAGGRIADLGVQDHLIVWAKTGMHVQWRWPCRARISIMVMEPKIMSAVHHRLLPWTWRRFHRVFSYDENLLIRIGNGAFLPFGTTWVQDWAALRPQKQADLSLIASAKRDHPGHKLRHEIAAHLQANRPEVDILGRGYRPFQAKADGLAPYRYSVVIENVRERNYFSEKLIDAILCETVPIYWGCPNIGDFLAPGAMMTCGSEDEIHAAIAQISAEDYALRLPGLRAIKEQAAYLGQLEQRAVEILLTTL